MSRRAFERAGLVVGLAVLLVILASATLLDRRPPSVERISLSRTTGDPLVALTHATVDVQFSEPVRRSGAEFRFRITPAVDGTYSWADDRTLIFTPRQKLPVATDFSIHLESGYEDMVGNDATDPSEPLRFRTVDLPQVTAMEPADGADGVALAAPLTITFDRLMDTAVTVAALTIEPQVEIRTTWRGNTLIVSPMTAFAAGTRYRLTLSTAAADTDGNPLASAEEMSFSTVETGLGIVRLLPSDGSAGAPVDGDLALVFDAPIDPATIDQALQLTPPVAGTARVVSLPEDSGPASAAETDTVLVFDPSERLAPHTTYTVELRPGVVGAADADQVAEGRSWSFTTGSPSEALQNQVVFLSARSGVRNVWAMNPDGTGARQLTAEVAPVTSYDLAPDGGALVYSSAGSVRLLTLPAGQTRTLSAPGVADYAPRLLPDESAVIVWRRDREEGTDEGLWLLPTDGGTPRQLFVAGSPPFGSSSASAEVPDVASRTYPWGTRTAVSDDGQTLLAVTASGAVARLSPTTVVIGAGPLLRLIDTAGPPVWSSRLAGFIVAARLPADRLTGAWLVPPTGEPERLTDLGGWPDSLGNALVGLSSEEPHRVDFRRSPRISGTRLTNTPGLLDRQPTFVPGGSAVVFGRVAESDPERSMGIWLVGTDGRGLRQLSPDGSDPRWLP